MTTRYEFGFGYGEMYRRRRQGREQMRQETQDLRRRLPEEERWADRYGSDYYGFRGAGRRGSYATEYRVQWRPAERVRRYFGPGPRP